MLILGSFHVTKEPTCFYRMDCVWTLGINGGAHIKEVDVEPWPG
jgi:hypothetical protein